MSQAGTILIAVGVGLAFFLRALVPLKPVWTIGIIVMLIGAVVVLFAYFSQEPDSRGEAPGHRASD